MIACTENGCFYTGAEELLARRINRAKKFLDEIGVGQDNLQLFKTDGSAEECWPRIWEEFRSASAKTVAPGRAASGRRFTMIVADPKPFGQVKGYLENFEKILIVGCGTCTTVCLAGGEAEVQILASGLRIAFGKEGLSKTILEDCVQRQCDEEFILPVLSRVENEKIDAVVSLACGVGVNFFADRLGKVPIFPGIGYYFLRRWGRAGALGGDVRRLWRLHDGPYRWNMPYRPLLEASFERAVRRI